MAQLADNTPGTINKHYDSLHLRLDALKEAARKVTGCRLGQAVCGPCQQSAYTVLGSRTPAALVPGCSPPTATTKA